MPVLAGAGPEGVCWARTMRTPTASASPGAKGQSRARLPRGL